MGSSRGIVIQAEELGKYKTTLQIFAISGLLLHHCYFSIDFHLGGMYFLWASLVLSIWSAISYLLKFWSQGAKAGGEP
jgi:CDP-diacylglycerol--glycerol-3-phosphate 3-phosphatidyltransferase